MLKKHETLILILIAIIPLINPHFLYQTINLFELGLYLPGIQAINQGLIPYKDFFYLRGPFELYLPTWLMQIFGMQVSVLALYFYIGSILTVVVSALLANLVIPVRWLMLGLVPILVVKTFPRVVFSYWGGMRYVWGLLAVLLAVQFIRTSKHRWLFGAGILTSIGLLTSIEIGISAAIAITGGLIVYNVTRQQQVKSWLLWLGGLAVVIVPYGVYLLMAGALDDYVINQWVVITSMTKTFLLADKVPASLPEALYAMVNPVHENFKLLTPAYAYVFFAGYCYWRAIRREFSLADCAVVVVAIYGLMIYITGFRNLFASVFEMSLQPQKIVMFYLLAQVFLWLKANPKFKIVAYVVLVGVLISSIAFAIGRLPKRYFGKLGIAKPAVTQSVDVARLKGYHLPVDQATDAIELHNFVNQHIAVNEPILMYPELGAMHFILNRPWVGKFPTVTLSWLNDEWFDGYLKTLNENPPRFAIINKQMPDYFKVCYLPVMRNQQKYDLMLGLIKNKYAVVASTPNYNIYQLR